VSGQSSRSVAVEYIGLFRIRFAAIDVCHRGTVDDHIWVVFGEDIIKRIVFPEIELREWNIECRLRRVIGSIDSPLALLTCTYDVTAEEAVCTDDQESHK
jgi:hypothetical protein